MALVEGQFYFKYPVKDDEELVKFVNVRSMYDMSCDLQVEFVAGPEVRYSIEDLIIIYEPDWGEGGDIVAYRSVYGEKLDDSGRKRKMTFRSDWLKQRASPETVYQFVYLNRHREVLGISTSFGFHSKDLIVKECAPKKYSGAYFRKTLFEIKEYVKTLLYSCVQSVSDDERKANLESHCRLLMKRDNYPEYCKTYLFLESHLFKCLGFGNPEESVMFKEYIDDITNNLLDTNNKSDDRYDEKFVRDLVHMRVTLGQEELAIQQLQSLPYTKVYPFQVPRILPSTLAGLVRQVREERSRA